jgi:hypothetical protein
MRSPILISLFAFDNLLKDAVNKRYIVANAGSNPAPDLFQDFFYRFFSFKQKK